MARTSLAERMSRLEQQKARLASYVWSSVVAYNLALFARLTSA